MMYSIIIGFIIWSVYIIKLTLSESEK